MLPRTHEAILRAAVARVASGEAACGDAAWGEADLAALLRGHRDEDDFVVLGLRFRAPGLTHTYRPGRRFGELFATNAKTKMLLCVRRAAAHDLRARRAWWLGRACHLLGDMAVPARTRGVWHLAGDPLEAWLEARPSAIADLARASVPALRDGCSPDALAELLARASSAHEADTTRTPWGFFLYERTGTGKRLYEKDVAEQAGALVPLAVACTAALLRAAPPRP